MGLKLLLRGGGVYHKNTTPGQLGNNIGEKLLVGESCSLSVLWLISWGDSTLESAKENGGIQKVGVIDRKSKSVFYRLYYEECIIVWGE